MTDQKPKEPDETTNQPADAAVGALDRGLVWRSIIEPTKHPTGKQKESYARFVHTLSAACFIGAIYRVCLKPMSAPV